ncbi:hypothetical protein KAFR_0I02550 [Kazachstania africana CBS 2517]|uniref:Dynein light intermediate chain n=1 Tax=Kazachstania africana (strain ATCC 22294 / BCRC 22015 / CBS 2517 / CECT 1963 / NBRC 1671 / NRRL Y-8276) TaxID=1071382 RepID=H2B084_KAZAF|nr:hypothetical protein KAFR_0I02550 [Kazachstania africana CBS 2517]CCF60034.1 hypothetical protein KAFR_0I02550 [Kazachstania africana CBS 2517]
MVRDIWTELINKTRRKDDDTSGKTIIVCCPSKDTMYEFQKKYYPTELQESIDEKPTTQLQFHYIMDTSRSEDIDRSPHGIVNIYSMVSPVEHSTLSLLHPIIEQIRGNVQLCVVLDWSKNSQRSWLRYLNDMFKELQVFESLMQLHVICVNSNVIWELQRSSTSWNTRLIGFVQQSLRSFCLEKNGSLYFLQENGTIDILTDIIHENTHDDTRIEMIDISKTFIPSGSDSFGLIKTIDDTFDPSIATTDEFIATQYEKAVPEAYKPSYGNSELLKGASYTVYEDPQASDYYQTLLDFDVQKKLSEINKTYRSKPLT